MAPSRKIFNIAQQKELYLQAKSTTDSQELRNIVIKLYSRILELTDVVLGGEEERAQLIKERDLLTANNIRLDHELINQTKALEQQKAENIMLRQQIQGSDAMVAKLTEWNGSLERQCTALQESILQNQANHERSFQALQMEAIDSTRKMIGLREELDALEEDLFCTRRSLRESHDLRDKIIQENAILKSKLYDLVLKTRVNETSDRTPTIKSINSNHLPLLDEILLDNESSIKKIGKIMQQSLGL